MRESMIRIFIALALLLSFTLVWAQEPAQDQQPSGKSSQTAPDNTARNQRDRNQSEATADQQSENASDRALAQQIRRALVNDKSLSTYAHNIKVIVKDGVVTLKGPVKSAEEKQAVETKAAEAAGGPDKISSQIEIAGQ